jgi:hypothetical protein
VAISHPDHREQLEGHLSEGRHRPDPGGADR